MFNDHAVADFGLSHTMREKGMNAAEYLGVDLDEPEEQPASPGHDWRFWAPFWAAAGVAAAIIVVGMLWVGQFYPATPEQSYLAGRG